MNRRIILNYMLVDLFNHILYLEEQNLQLKGINLTMNEIHTIEAISDIINPTMSSVAHKLMITLGTLTTAIKKLEKKGYVTRVKDENDARIVRLSLTKKAVEVLNIHDEFHVNMIETVLDDLSEEEEEVFLKSILKIQYYFENNQIK